MQISAPTPVQQKTLKDFTGRLAAFLNKEAAEVGKTVDYGMLCVPLVACAVQVLQTRGFNKDDIEQAILQSMDRQFKKPDGPNLILIQGG